MIHGTKIFACVDQCADEPIDRGRPNVGVVEHSPGFQCLRLMKGLVDDIPRTISGNLWVKDQCIVVPCLVASRAYHRFARCSAAIVDRWRWKNPTVDRNRVRKYRDSSVLHEWGVLIVQCLRKGSVELTIDESLLTERWSAVMELLIPALISARRSWGFFEENCTMEDVNSDGSLRVYLWSGAIRHSSAGITSS